MTLTKNGYLPRVVDAGISELLECYGAVCIEGMKFCGKTWTACRHANSMIQLDDVRGDYHNLRATRADPAYALSGEAPRLIDEWQAVPAVWDGVRQAVDESGGTGRFILCGSSVPKTQTPEEKKAGVVRHSGLGRICSVRMRTMSLLESGDSDGSVSLRGMFDGGRISSPERATGIEAIADLIVRGGWPANVGRGREAAARWVSRLPSEICERDVFRTDPSKDGLRVRRLMSSLARNESSLASNRTLATDIKVNSDDAIKDSTVSDYLSLMDRMFLIEDQPAFDPNARSSLRVGKAPKRHLTDPALSVAALGMNAKTLVGDLNTLGLMFEALCERDLQIYASASGGRLHHYRDGRGNEIDAVVEMPDGRWGAFEIKTGMSQTDAAAEKLLRLKGVLEDDLAAYSDPGKPRPRPPAVLGVVCATAPAAYMREDGVAVVPITALGVRPAVRRGDGRPSSSPAGRARLMFPSSGRSGSAAASIDAMPAVRKADGPRSCLPPAYRVIWDLEAMIAGVIDAVAKRALGFRARSHARLAIDLLNTRVAVDRASDSYDVSGPDGGADLLFRYMGLLGMGQDNLIGFKLRDR